VGKLYNFQKTAQSTQLPIGRKIAQSGHSDTYTTVAQEQWNETLINGISTEHLSRSIDRTNRVCSFLQILILRRLFFRDKKTVGGSS
jgi:hypothetical protein